MITFFLTIVFLAEIILASWIISKIRKVNQAVIDYNEKIVQIQHKLKKHLLNAKDLVSKAHIAVDFFSDNVENKKSAFQKVFKNKGWTEIGLFLLNLPYKKILSVIEIILTIKKLLRV